MNRTMLRGKWRQARGGMKAEWGRLTDNDRRMLDGKIDQMLGLFQERYGYTQERASDALKHYLGGHANRRPKVSVKVPQGRFMIVSTVGLIIVAIAGWFTFAKLFSGKQPAVFAPEEGELAGLEDMQFEPEDFEAELMGYEAALD